MCRQVREVFDGNGRGYFIHYLMATERLLVDYRVERRIVMAALDQLLRRTARLPEDMQPPCPHPEVGCPTLVQRPPLSTRLSDYIRRLSRNRGPYLAPAEVTSIIQVMNGFENELAQRLSDLDEANRTAAISPLASGAPRPPVSAPPRTSSRRVGAWTSSLNETPSENLDGSLALTHDLLRTLTRAATRMRRAQSADAARTAAFNQRIIAEHLRLSPEEQGYYARCGATLELARRNMDSFLSFSQATEIIRFEGEALGSACRETPNYDTEMNTLLDQREALCRNTYAAAGTETRICTPTQMQQFRVNYNYRQRSSAPEGAETPAPAEPAQPGN